ncbi:MAG: hypothetical protein QM777_16865 [Pseudorhodoferax sp.]
MASKKTPERPTFVQSYVFDDDSKMSVPLDELAYQYLLQAAKMLASDNPAFRQSGDTRLREASKVLGAIENRQLWQSLINKENAQKKRPSGKVDADEDDTIEKEFARLVREGHSEREARGIMVSWGKWSQPTIYRRTNGTEEN